jgi:glyoxalase/bleomycin resistance protein/dioxygenase superfamily protein
MSKPVFTETMQIGIVVRDLDAAIRRYVNDYGIGPWDVSEFNPGNVKDLREYGKPVKRSWRLAVAMIGHVQWELIEPLDDESIYARFLAERGGACTTLPSLLQTSTRRWGWRRNVGMMWSLAACSAASRLCTSPPSGIGVLIEIFSGNPKAKEASRA